MKKVVPQMYSLAELPGGKRIPSWQCDLCGALVGTKTPTHDVWHAWLEDQLGQGDSE